MASLGALGNLGAIFVDLGLDTQGLADGIASAEGKLQRAGKSLTRVGGIMTAGVSLPIIALGVDILQTAAEFESSMQNVLAKSGATEAQFASMTSVAKELGSTTRFSAVEAAEGMVFLAQAGLDSNDIIEAMPGLLSLAAAGQLELGQAADFATNIMSGFGMEAGDLASIADKLALAAASSNTSVVDLAQALSFAAPVAKTAGLSLDETIASIGVLGDSGIQATRAGTGLRGMIASLVAPSGDAAGIIQDLGVDIEALRAAGDSPLAVLNALNDQGIELAEVFKVFGREAASAATVLGDGSPRIKEFTAELANADGASQKMADTMNEGLKGSMVSLMSAMEGLKLAIADSGLLEFVGELVTKSVDIVRALTKTNPKFLKMGVVVAAVAAAIGPLLVVVGAMVAAIGTIGLPVAAAIAGIVALSAGFIAFRSELEDSTLGLVGSVGESFLSLQTTLADIFGDVQADMLMAWETVKIATQPILESLIGIVQDSIAIIAAVVAMPGVKQTIGLAWDLIKTVVVVAWDVISGVVIGSLDVIGGVIKTVLGIITLDWDTFSGGLVQIAEGLWTAIVGVFTGGVDLIVGVVGGLYDAVTGIFSDMGDDLVGNSIVPDDIVDPIAKEFDGLSDQVQKSSANLRKGVLKEFKLLDKGLAKLGKRVNLVENSFESMQGVLKNRRAADRQGRALKAFEKDIISADRAAGNFEDGVVDLLGVMNPAPLTGMSRAAGDLEDQTIGLGRATLDLGQSFRGLGKTLISTLLSGGSVGEALKGFFSDLGNQLLDLASERVFGALLGQFDKLIGKVPGLNKVSGALGDILGSAGGQTATNAAGQAVGTVGDAAAAGGGLLNLVNVIANIGTLISSIIQNFQLAKMETTLNAIEESTRRGTLFLGDRPDQGILGQLFIIAENSGWSVKNLDDIKSHVWSIDAAMSRGIESTGSFTPSFASDSSGVQVTIGQITINGSIRSDSDIDRLAEQVGDRIVQRIRDERPL